MVKMQNEQIENTQQFKKKKTAREEKEPK